MNHPRSARLWSALTLLAAGALAGCSALPSSPGSNAIRDPDFVRVASQPAGTLSLAATGPTSSSKNIDGNKGGSLTVGRFTVQVPPGAYKGPATITITVPDQNLLVCDLGISPAAANNFAVPVTLTNDYQNTNVTDSSQLLELWYDAAARVWRVVPGYTVDTAKKTVSAPLSHFSDYGVYQGKAGW